MTTQQIKAAIKHYTKLVKENKGETLFANRELGKLFKVAASEAKEFGLKAYVVLCLGERENEIIHEHLREEAVQSFRDWAQGSKTWDPAQGWVQD